MDTYEEYEFELVQIESGEKVIDTVDHSMNRLARHLASEIIDQLEDMVDRGDASREFKLTLNRYWEE